MSPEFNPGDRVEYSGSYINARGIGRYVGQEREGSTLWHCVKINGSYHRVLGSLTPA